ncbi:MAG: hypothetical protein SFY69_09265 [Planctomycetota bacterium]|nr:hypothetical protein [Planctomycetota bacterium]
MNRRPTVLALAAALFSGVGVFAPEAAGQTFQLLSSPPGITSEWAFGLSDDGGVVVGNGVGGAFFWTPQGGFEHFAPNTSSPYAGWGYGVSGDGTTAVGGARYAGDSTFHAYRFRRGGTLEILGRQAGYQNAYAQDASYDGSVVVGRSESFDGAIGQAFRWTSATGLVGLGYTQPGHAYSEAAAISRDGTTIVGHSRGGYSDAFVWTSTSGMVALPDIAGGIDARAHGVNHDGSIVVGVSVSSLTAVRWINGVSESLGVASGYFQSIANATSDDGNVIVGGLGGSTGVTAGIWTPDRGMERLSDYLAFHGVQVPAGINLLTATAVSADGRTFVGYTGIPGPGLQGWIATVPAPSAILIFMIFFPATARRANR